MSKPHQKFLKEGQAVIINAFQLKDYLGEFRTNPYPYKIGFFRTTKFANFDHILSGQLDKNVLVDVIGQIVIVGPLEQIKQRGRIIQNLILFYRTNHLVPCKLIGSIVHWFQTMKTFVGNGL
ncbi:hypothetical protein Bca52824_057687 [Brassica carinata]|uniref:DUF223 domain-containing protein n=1 Tax=Brassica carinata TaxID=52824 RepID=A0A8X7UDX1_BRACI|nr:hypothetical protein Bca52824_057687 [Brassica carinata]